MGISWDGVRDAQYASAATGITTDGDEDRLCTQDGHEAERVSNVRASRKRACLCGVRVGEQLLTCDHRLLGRDVKAANGTDLLACGGRKVDEIRRRGSRWRRKDIERDTDPIEHLSDRLSRFPAPLPLLCRSEIYVGSLRTSHRRRKRRRMIHWIT
jgi:hypothetical protein